MPRVQAALLFGLFLTPPAAAAQRGGASSDVGQRARDAVARLARVVRENLPRGVGSAGDPLDPCPKRIGRICHWSEGEDAPDPPPEAPAVIAARARAIALLDSAAAVAPSDGWVAGQRVRLLSDAHSHAAAVAAARTCSSDVTWCSELAGYALHQAGDYGGSDSAFAVALARMKPSDRCLWQDPSPLLEEALRDRLAPSGCEARETLAERLWWLAAPLYLESTVDARTEYYSRLTRSRMADDAPQSELFGWDDDTRRTSVRFGWPLWYSQDPPYPGQIAEPAVVGHERGGSYYFFPTARSLDSLGLVDSADWHLDDPRAQSAYSPAYARSIHSLPSAIARFRRGGRMMLVAVWDAGSDATVAGDRRTLIHGFFVGTRPHEMRGETGRPGAASGATGMITDNDTAIASIEILDTATHRAARARRGILPLPRAPYGISDLLLLKETPDAARPGMNDLIAVARMPRADSAAVLYFELYTPPDSVAPVSMELHLSSQPRGWAHRFAQRLHLARSPSALALRWRERADASGTTPRALRLDLSRIDPGLYAVRIIARDAGGRLLAESHSDLLVADPL